MSLLDAVALLVVAGVCALFSRALRGFSLRAWVRELPAALIGSGQGYLLARLVALPDVVDLSIAGRRFPVAWTVAGAVLLLWACARLEARGRRARRTAGAARAA